MWNPKFSMGIEKDEKKSCLVINSRAGSGKFLGCVSPRGENINTYKVILILHTLPHKPACSVGVTVHSSCLTHSYNYMLPSLYILSLILAFWASFCSASFTKWLGYFVWHFHCAVDIMRQRNVTNTRNYLWRYVFYRDNNLYYSKLSSYKFWV